MVSFETCILSFFTPFVQNIHCAENYLRVAHVELRAILVCLLFKSDYNQNWNGPTYFSLKLHNMKSKANPFIGSRDITFRNSDKQTSKHTDITNLTNARFSFFRTNVNYGTWSSTTYRFHLVSSLMCSRSSVFQMIHSSTQST